MSLAATFLGGAKSRLLPPSIPFRFFGAAVLFHIAGWAVLVAAAPDLPGFTGGPGLPLAGLHLITLGVLAMTAVGAAAQLLPVATRQSLRTLWPIKLVFWLIVPGVLLLGHGLATLHRLPLAVGETLTTIALGLFGLILADNLRRARDLPMVAAFGWVAVVSLFALAVIGGALLADFRTGFLPDHAAYARAHLIIATYGFMGMLALGFSHVLIPMFALSPAPDKRLGRASFGAALAGLIMAAAGALLNADGLLIAGALAGLAGIGLHLWLMKTVMDTRMRKRMGHSFVLVRVAWGLLPLSVILGLLDIIGLAPTNGGTLFGFVLVFGWLLTFLTGILQRIIPFLGSMHAAGSGGRPPLVSALTPELPLKAHGLLHAIAIVSIAIGIVLDAALLVRLGALAGLGGALAFAVFAALVAMRLRGRPAA